nr:hypothetical protein [Tanacetum cinerariifolium]
MVFIVNSVLAYCVDLVLEKEFASFALQVLKIHSHIQSVVEMSRQREQAANLSTHTFEPLRHFSSFCYDDDDEERTIPLLEDPEDSLIMGNEELSTISEKESDEFIKSSVGDLVPILKDIECKDFYDSNLDESTFLVTPLSDSNEDEYFTPGDDVKLLLHRDPSMSVASILEGFTDEPPLEENDDLFDLESKENDSKKILYDAPIDDLMSEDKVFDLGICVNFFLQYMITPDLEASRARGFVHRPLEL